MAESYQQFVPHRMDDRAYWDAIRTQPVHAQFWAAVQQRLGAAPPVPPMPTATDYLAAKRHNNRDLLDRHWHGDRLPFAAMAIRRAVLGVDPDDFDDRLLNWLFAFLTEASWVVSAHLPGYDLPASGAAQLDLAACEMAAALAEMREVLKPWMDQVSGTLADSIVTEIDRRVLTPFAEMSPQWWADANHPILNNWTGVCAGSILTACESLAAQGCPRPRARERAIRCLQVFLDRSFTKHGECDEGVGYWSYGVGFAILGLSRLSQEELRRSIDLVRLRQIASYPEKAHLFEDCYFVGNDGGTRWRPDRSLARWLTNLTGSEWLWQQACRHQQYPLPWHFSLMLRDAAVLPPAGGDAPRAKEAPTSAALLEDQQVGILRMATPRGELVACLSGGNNDERHNHNDLGHFLIALNHEIIVPDLGAPEYTPDLFGPNRYKYLLTSSRGHCCPSVGEFDQRTGPEAQGGLLEWRHEGPTPSLRLDLTAAYPPESGLSLWVRSLEARPATSEAPARMAIADQYRVEKCTKITHAFWSLHKPVVCESQDLEAVSLQLGPLCFELVPLPAALRVVEMDPKAHLMRGRTEPIYRIEATYDIGPEDDLSVSSSFFVS